MIANITNYFTNLNNAGQALFVVGVLLVITFIILLIVVLKPEKNTVKKIYGESEITQKGGCKRYGTTENWKTY